MLNRLIDTSLRHKAVVLVLTAILAAIGAVSLGQLPFDAFPDTTPVQVQVNTVGASLSPLEVERQITFPIEQVIGGLVGLDQVRSLSKFGFSQVTAMFEDGTDVYLARQVVMERLQTVELCWSQCVPLQQLSSEPAFVLGAMDSHRNRAAPSSCSRIG